VNFDVSWESARTFQGRSQRLLAEAKGGIASDTQIVRISAAEQRKQGLPHWDWPREFVPLALFRQLV